MARNGLRRWRAIALLGALAVTSAACGGGGGGGGDDDAAGEDAGAEERASDVADVDEQGVLRLAVAIRPNQGVMVYDIAALPTPALDIHELIYDTLLHAQMDGTYEPGIATGAEVTDPSTIEVTIREGVKFNDGSPLTPEDVRFSILRYRDSQNGTFGAEMQEISDVTVDGQEVDVPNRLAYKGMMLEGVPNFALAFGYTNASWTLKADLTCDYVGRLLNHLRAVGLRQATPTNTDPSIERQPLLGLTSGYVQRAADRFPKAGSKFPWQVHQNYLKDHRVMKRSPIDDGALVFSNPPGRSRPAPVDREELIA